MAKRGLGRGLEALIPSDHKVEAETGVMEISVNDIEPNTYQPRRNFREEALEELSASIREHGVVQPVVVRKLNDERYELVTGERRWRACRKIGLAKIPAVIKDFNDQEITEIALIENIQREDLSALEEAGAYRTLLEEFSLTQEELAKRIGKSRSFIANMLRLLNLPLEVQMMIETNQLTAGHARAILSISNEKQQLEAANLVVKRELNVRQTEEFVKQFQKSKETKDENINDHKEKDPILVDLEERFGEILGTKVYLKPKNIGGKIEIEYYSNDELERIFDIVGGQID